MHCALVILDFCVIENLVQSLYLNYLNNCLIPDTYFSHIEVVRFAKYCPIKTKEEAYYFCAEFVTFDNAVNAMPRIIRRCSKTFYVFFITCGLSAVRIIGRKLR